MAVKDGNLRIYPGEVHALMGGNGAGKSTMIKIIAGAHQADSGEILLDGNAVAFKHPKEAMDSGIQVVYQELSLLPHLTVSENIAMPSNDVVRHGIYDWEKSDALAEKALSKLGSAAADINPHDIVSQLRPDQMQMVEIARAVGQNAKIILLDEPTSSLNFEETEKLFESIRGLCSHGTGIIFVSHRMNEVRELSDRITILRDGVVIVDGVPMSEKTDEEIVSDNRRLCPPFPPCICQNVRYGQVRYVRRPRQRIQLPRWSRLRLRQEQCHVRQLMAHGPRACLRHDYRIGIA